LTLDKPTFTSKSENNHPSCWYTVNVEEYKWINENSKIKLTFHEITSTAEVTLFTGNGLTNITDYIDSNNTIALGAPFYFDLTNPPFIVIGHKTKSIPGSLSFSYEVIGTEYEWWRLPYMKPEEQWKWTAIRWSTIMFIPFLVVLATGIGLCCCYCKCCKRCCRCCRRKRADDKVPKEPDMQKSDVNKVKPMARSNSQATAQENNEKSNFENNSNISILQDANNVELSVVSIDN